MCVFRGVTANRRKRGATKMNEECKMQIAKCEMQNEKRPATDVLSHFAICIFHFALLLLLAAPAYAANPAAEPAEPGPSSWSSFRNGNLQLGVAHTELPENLEVLWKIDVTDGVTGTAAIVGGRVYIPTFGGELICADRDTGEKFWTY